MGGASSLVASGVSGGLNCAAEGQREPTATDDTGRPRVSGGVRATATETFDNWDDMKNAHRGTVTRFLDDNKPLGSPVPRTWFEKGGTLRIDTLDDGSHVWTYTDATGASAHYEVDAGSRMGRIVFSDADLHHDSNIAHFSIGEFSGDRSIDNARAIDYLAGMGYKKGVPDGYVLHHDIDNGVMQVVSEHAHQTFSHYGGHYYNKPK
jgi:hypothetical protein